MDIIPTQLGWKSVFMLRHLSKCVVLNMAGQLSQIYREGMRGPTRTQKNSFSRERCQLVLPSG